MKDTTVNNVAVAAAVSAALDCFPMPQFKAALNDCSKAKSKETKSTGERVSHSMTMCDLMYQYSMDCAKISEDHGLKMGDYRDNIKLILKVFAAKKHAFVEFSDAAKRGDPPVPKWNTTANNAISTAKGVVDFHLDPATCLNDKGENTWTAVQKEVQKLRKERKDEANPDAALLALAKSDCKDEFAKLTAVVFATGDIDLIERLTAQLDAMKTLSIEQIAAQVELDKKVKAEAAAATVVAIADALKEDEAKEIAEIAESDAPQQEAAVA